MEPEAVLKMEVVAEQIFNFLSVEDSKNARLVCRVWSLEGARQILLKGYFRVPPRFHKEKSSKKIKEEKTLIFNFVHPKKLEDGIEKTTTRKVPNVWITNAQDAKILSALGVLSGNVTTLRFPSFCQEEETSQDRKQLRSLFKNLLSSKLTSLTAFHFNEPTPALTRDTPVPLNYIEQFSKLGKGHVVKSLCLNFSGSRCAAKIKSYENFLEATPHLALESLIFGNGLQKLRQKRPALFARVINILNKVFALSATSLKKLEVTGTLGEVNELEIQILPNLTTLTVVLPPKNQNSRLFPKMAEHFCFPNLSKVTIGILGTDWMDRRRFQEISLQDKEKLLPGINPELKFSVYENNHIGTGKNQLLVCPPNSVPEAETRQLNEEGERLYEHFRWWCYFGGIFLGGLFLVLFVVIFTVVHVQKEQILKTYASLQGLVDKQVGIWNKELGEMNRQIYNKVKEIDNMVNGLDQLPRTVCIGEEYTWKIPPIFACPKSIMDDETTATTSLNAISNWALNLQQFTCQQAATFSNELQTLQLF